MTGQIIASCAISVDGFAAGPNQSLDKPFGEGVGDKLHRWMFQDQEANSPEINALHAHGAYIIGRNMFGPGRGEWDLDWKGWWGETPPYRAPVFVLTHYPRERLVMNGGTTFTFVNDGIQAALNQAREVSGDRSVSIHGGADVIRQYLAAGLVDELRLFVAPVILGVGESIFAGLPSMQLEQISARQTKFVTHLTYRVEKMV